MKPPGPLDRFGDLSLFERVPVEHLLCTRRLAIGRVVAGKSTRIATQAGSKDDLFEIGSVTKAINGLLAADALMRGEVTLDDPIRQFFPEWSRRPLGEATLRQLATHTSGLPTLPWGAVTTVRALAALAGLNPYWGTAPSRVLRSANNQWLRTRGRFRYSNLGAVVAAEMLARAAETEYDELLQARIFAPIGLENTWLNTRNSSYPRGRSPWFASTARWRDKGYAAAGGIVSSISDMTRLAEWLIADPSGLAAVAFTSLDGAIAGESLGLFWVMTQPSGSRACWHNGETGGYSAYFALNPERGVATVVLSDTADSENAKQIAFAASKN